ncbi:MAG: SAM-dependent methyltransferase [Anaerolineaceae bacterium]|jgi:methyltransferase (TIGR00027 family)
MTTITAKTIPAPVKGQKDSSTAGFTCLDRAFASHEADPRFRGPDYLADIFLPPRIKFIFGLPGVWKLFYRWYIPRGSYEYVLARTRFMDEVFINALNDAFTQIAVLGAGFDTRALRFQYQNNGTKIFELDQPGTQKPKLEIYQRKGVTLPKELTFLPADFKNQCLEDILISGGFQPGQKNLFLWEGVTMYLTAEAVDQTLKTIHRLSAKGSLVAFDYIYASVLRHEGRYDDESKFESTIAKTGEKWTFGIEEGQIVPFLTSRGFKPLSVFLTADIERLYLTAEDGTLFGHANGTHCLVLAAVQ